PPRPTPMPWPPTRTRWTRATRRNSTPTSWAKRPPDRLRPDGPLMGRQEPYPRSRVAAAPGGTHGDPERERPHAAAPLPDLLRLGAPDGGPGGRRHVRLQRLMA